MTTLVKTFSYEHTGTEFFIFRTKKNANFYQPVQLN